MSVDDQQHSTKATTTDARMIKVNDEYGSPRKNERQIPADQMTPVGPVGADLRLLKRKRKTRAWTSNSAIPILGGK